MPPAEGLASAPATLTNTSHPAGALSTAAGDVSQEEARWRGVEDVKSGRATFQQAAAQFNEAVRSKTQDIESLLAVSVIWEV